ncbi:MAG: hypothetical protein ACXVA9_05330 [Bdellovibrionales bacterium]
MIKTATLITFLFMCRLSFADILDPNCAKCGHLKISDAKESKRLMNMLDANTKTEKFKEGSNTIVVSTKEMKLGDKTTITCSTLTENGKPIMRFRMSTPGCTIFQKGAGEGEDKPGAGAAAK